ncbi:MAG TPA: histidine phosphatase family protein [Candidatus Paceibacterota bacterium]|nr:histidine phosphatase family protein [Candidatus Paceibacterota bacterium]
MKYVYIARHGESDANIGNVFQGPHSALTAKGREQAALLATRAARLPIEAIIASPWTRARATAEAISERIGIPVEYSDLFTERRKPDILEGKEFGDPQYQPLYDEWSASLFADDAPAVDGGENFAAIIERADRALAHLEARPERHIFVVSHGFFTRVLGARAILGDMLTGPHLEAFTRTLRNDNTGITTFSLDDAWRIATWNDRTHLAELETD